MALDLAGRKDEIGGMFGAVRVFRDNAIERRRLAEQTEAEQQARALRQETIEGLINDFRLEIEQLVGVVAGNADQMEATARALAAIAEEARDRAGTAASASELASDGVQTVAAAAEGVPVQVLGEGTNVLVPDEGFPGWVVLLRDDPTNEYSPALDFSPPDKQLLEAVSAFLPQGSALYADDPAVIRAWKELVEFAPAQESLARAFPPLHDMRPFVGFLPLTSAPAGGDASLLPLFIPAERATS